MNSLSLAHRRGKIYTKICMNYYKVDRGNIFRAKRQLAVQKEDMKKEEKQIDVEGGRKGEGKYREQARQKWKKHKSSKKERERNGRRWGGERGVH